MRRRLLIALTLGASLFVATSGAQAILINDHGVSAGVALVPGTCGDLASTGACASLANAGVANVSSSGPCTDPWLSADLGGPSLANWGICYRGGSVMHKNETFALTWDAPTRTAHSAYWSLTRGYVEQFLRDVADSSGSLNSPYAVTPQYHDSSGRAQNASVYGGGCIDYGSVGGSACEYGDPDRRRPRLSGRSDARHRRLVHVSGLVNPNSGLPDRRPDPGRDRDDGLPDGDRRAARSPATRRW